MLVRMSNVQHKSIALGYIRRGLASVFFLFLCQNALGHLFKRLISHELQVRISAPGTGVRQDTQIPGQTFQAEDAILLILSIATSTPSTAPLVVFAGRLLDRKCRRAAS